MTTEGEWLEIASLDLEAQGIARNVEGKVVFVDGALPGELARVRVVRRKKQWEKAELVELGRESSQRVRPRCPHFGLAPGACGGCKMQHLDLAAQVAMKQRVLEDTLWHVGKVRPAQVLRPIEGPGWGYRLRARLSMRWVAKKGTVLVGFHERKSSYVADMRECHVLPPHVAALLLPLRELVGAMHARERVPQVEVAVGDEVTALVLRHLEPLDAHDLALLREFGACRSVQWWLQPKGPDSARRLAEGGAKLETGPGLEGGPEQAFSEPAQAEPALAALAQVEPAHAEPAQAELAQAELAYALPEFGVRMPFEPTDFTQVNQQVNTVLVGRAVRLLDPGEREDVIDWFCGLGNFTLPLATRARSALGVEGSRTLVDRALANAGRNGLAQRARFDVRNLFEISADDLVQLGRADKWLVDPPREGAFALAKAVAELQAAPRDGWDPPRRIVYVSCNPATLARDAGLLVHRGGYRCSAAGAVNMFPHTAHVESLAVFDRDPDWRPGLEPAFDPASAVTPPLDADPQ